MFFAVPCTGGSSRARLNRSKGPQTEAIIQAKVLIFKQVWGRFEVCSLPFMADALEFTWNCREFQGGPWSAMGTDTKKLGPKSRDMIVNDILPEMEDFDKSFKPSGREGLAPEERLSYVNLEVRKLSAAPKRWCKILAPRFQ